MRGYWWSVRWQCLILFVATMQCVLQNRHNLSAVTKATQALLPPGERRPEGDLDLEKDLSAPKTKAEAELGVEVEAEVESERQVRHSDYVRMGGRSDHVRTMGGRSSRSGFDAAAADAQIDTGSRPTPGDPGYVRQRATALDRLPAMRTERSVARLVSADDDDDSDVDEGKGGAITIPDEGDGGEGKNIGQTDDATATAATAAAAPAASASANANASAPAPAPAAVYTGTAANTAGASAAAAASTAGAAALNVKSTGTPPLVERSSDSTASASSTSGSMLSEGAVQLQRILEYILTQIGKFNLVEFLDNLDYMSDVVPFMQYVMAMAWGLLRKSTRPTLNPYSFASFSYSFSARMHAHYPWKVFMLPPISVRVLVINDPHARPCCWLPPF
jgi:hypothetical protein